MFSTSINPKALQDFKASLHGEVIGPNDEGYESARRVWNGMVDRHPALIVRCVDVSDVISAVQFARGQDLTVAVRAGGHDVSGHGVCDDGLVIDLSLMKGIQVDPEKHIARAEAGLTSGEFLREAQTFGLALPTGVFSTVGLSGLTLGGGIGWLSSRYGLTIDTLLAVEVVTADGRLLTASASEHPDLFWALRGGGGNFGVATAFTFQLHPLAQVLRGSVIHAMTRTREVLRFYREYTRQCSDELTVNASLTTGPDGHPVVILDACYCGDDLAEGERVLAPLRTFGSPLVDLIRPMSVLENTALLDFVTPPGRCYAYHAEALPQLSDEAIEAAIAFGSTRSSPFSSIVFYQIHGAAMRIAPDATAFALRHYHFILEMIAGWTEREARLHREWISHFASAIAPCADQGVYVNFLADEGEARIRASYGPNYARLMQIKNRYDPENVFHVNQNIRPTR
jgi:FAD binding domain/Berberine and berberine like